jgi:2-C-methyl-D-erythritol 4-phosphate cytidylyltransferase
MNNTKDIAVILLAGGIGSRMKSKTPKQFLSINNKPIAQYSFDIFITLPNISEIVVVCAPEFRHLFSLSNPKITLTFAMPGERRQDSVFNGLNAIQKNVDYVCVHDSARPCINKELVQRVIDEARTHGAATVGMPIKFTVKESDHNNFVNNTPDRSRIWEIQTPQVIRFDWLHEGFQHTLKHNITVTDDVSVVELLKKPVKLVEGSYANIKITTPEDLILSSHLINN